MPNSQPRQRTLSGREWDGSFRPVGYRFTGWALTVYEKVGDGSERSWRLADAFTRLQRKRMWSEESKSNLLFSLLTRWSGAPFKDQPRPTGGSFQPDVLRVLLQLHWAGVSHLDDALWFFYDTSKSVDEFSGDETFYRFFVVANDEIVLEDAWLRDSPDSGFDPETFFVAGDEAEAAFWYLKFYRETRAGQLAVLRPDKPELFHYAEGRTPGALGLASMQAALKYDFSRTRAAVAKLERRLWTTNMLLLTLLTVAILALVRFWR